MRRARTDGEIEAEIRAWYERHKGDYNPHDMQAPPLVWSEYFQWLLDALDRERALSVTPVVMAGSEPSGAK